MPLRATCRSRAWIARHPALRTSLRADPRVSLDPRSLRCTTALARTRPHWRQALGGAPRPDHDQRPILQRCAIFDLRMPMPRQAAGTASHRRPIARTSRGAVRSTDEARGSLHIRAGCPQRAAIDFGSTKFAVRATNIRLCGAELPTSAAADSCHRERNDCDDRQQATTPSAGSCAGCRTTATATSPSTCGARSPSRWATRARSWPAPSSASPTRTRKFNPCHRHFPELLDAIKRGVAAAGGLALEFPTTSLHESTLAPNSMKFRNLMAMDTEEMIRAQPMDSVVLMGGCDKTVPAQLMGAASAGKPAIQLIGGPQMTSRYKDDRVGACTDCRKFWTQFRAGKIGKAEIDAVEGRLVTTAGTCAVMGTASTMAAIAEALGMTLPGTAAIPAVHADRLRAAEATGARAVALARSDLTPDKIITAGVDRERRARAAGARRLHQRRHPSGGHRRPARPQARPRAPQRAVRHDAGAGGRQAGRQRVLHGGLLRRRRHRRRAARAEAAAAPRLP